MTPVERTAWVVGLKLDAYAKSVLFVLAHRADATTGACWITVNRLAAEAGMSSRKVQLVIQELERSGLIEFERSAGRKANTYRLTYAANPVPRAPLNPARDAPLPISNRARRAPQPCTPCNPTVHTVHPEQVIEQAMEQEAPSAPSVWDIGKQWLSGALLRKLIREHGEGAVSQAITATDIKRPADPRPYLLGILKSQKQPELRRAAADW